MRPGPAAIAAILLLPPAAIAENPATEIEFLIDAVGTSECTFIRNGRRHAAEDAEAHLRMKYRRGRRHATTAELFIERLASKSSMSNKPYRIECPGEAAITTGEWLTMRLQHYRQNDRRAKLGNVG